ncbi:aminodeoxychorismate synthase component I [Pacificimonas sp. WHA3]|uniref:Aminodeoxychorismate synthase component I n=2 Tax=Pacificimonas pallii TaxID=2827236 RepID=A0ABS6SC73_9SPHN|nr:aminodeoxychorismate synthase component I [Pacificimonas pallii]MBV7255693.1 aminodeoxychorismate synthase component I [Pacificimonas pallii]
MPMRVYQGEIRRIAAHTHGDVRKSLAEVRAALADGLHVAGYLSYEAGGGFEPRMATARADRRPLVSFGVYRTAHLLTWGDLAAWIDGRRCAIGEIRSPIDSAAHAAATRRILDYILAGDIYQANLTISVIAEVSGHPLALYARLRAAQRMAHGAVIHEGNGKWLLSASPELFFRLEDGEVTARPMKGTALRGRSDAADKAAAKALAADPKNRAENLMITDLLRNDMSRIAAPGTVRVEDPFAIEAYPTVHQMVTTVKAELSQGIDVIDVIDAMFPCGSITGAPKIRATEIIDEVEGRARGVYTGSIGWMAPEGNSHFNVAIRTAELSQGRLAMGIGAGIVADSEPAAEWRETMAKARFLNMETRPFHLIETMQFDPVEGVPLLDYHMNRLCASADRLGFLCNRHEIRNLLQVLIGREKEARRVKLTLSRDGSHAFVLAALPPARETMTMSLAPLPVAPDDLRLFHKTSDRDFYDAARCAAHTDEVIFFTPDGLLTEGSFTNLFVRRGGHLLTPRAETGLLPGVLRASLLASGEAVEADLRAEDLANDVFIGNAVRGLLRAYLPDRADRQGI